MSCFEEAIADDMDSIYLMGEDVWAEGQSSAEYISGCRSSTKYAKGKWYVLKDDSGELLSSLIVYRIGPTIFGIGSIATPPPLRRQGYASKLIASLLKKMDTSEQGLTWFLYADIEPKFYERFGFQVLPKQYQRYQASTCMVKSANLDAILLDPNFSTPNYF